MNLHRPIPCAPTMEANVTTVQQTPHTRCTAKARSTAHSVRMDAATGRATAPAPAARATDDPTTLNSLGTGGALLISH